jgi:hypothetical protein
MRNRERLIEAWSEADRALKNMFAAVNRLRMGRAPERAVKAPSWAAEAPSVEP